MMQDFSDKVVLVTGAGSGMGRASALAFARQGAQVVVSDISVEGGQQTAVQIQQEGGEALFVRADISRRADVESLVAQAVERYGRLDIAHNNAGVEGQNAIITQSTDENWERVVSTVLRGTFYCLRAELRHMVAQGRGAIVNVASTAGLTGLAGFSAYVAAKHGVVGLTKVAAVEHARQGIRVNCVAPGVVLTPMFERVMSGSPATGEAILSTYPMGRGAREEEVIAAVLWLASDAASYVTGVTLPVDGSKLAH